MPLLDEFLSVETEHIDGLARRALIHRRLNQNELELADWTKVVRLDPKYANGHPWTYKGMVELTLGNSDEAIKSFTNAIDLEAQFLRYRNRATAYAIQSKIELALADFKKAAELDPKHQETWTNVGSTQMRLGLAKEAIAAFTTAIAINPESAADSLAMLPAAYILDGQTKIGLHELETLFKENPSDLANLHLSIAYLSTGKFESYKSECKELLNRLTPESKDKIATSVWICSLSPNALSDYAPLIQRVRQIVEQKPNDQQYLLRLGSILLRAGQYQEAKIEIEKGLSFPFKEDVSSAPYLYLFALLKEHLGDHESAVKQFDEAEKQAQAELGQYPRWNRKLAIQILGKEASEVVMAAK